MKIDNESQVDSLSTMLEEIAFYGLEKRVAEILAKYPEQNAEQQVYWNRLNSELDFIKQAEFSGDFLMISDIVNWAKDHSIPVGPGRGPIVGSLVAYAIRITDIDPLQYNLLFERCLNSEHRILPAVDIDFCVDRRDEVIQYVMGKYGGDLDCDGYRLRIHLPVKHNHEGSDVTPYATKSVEATSPVVLNFQGLKHLTSNNKAVQLIRANKSPDFDLANLRDDDPATFKLISLGKTKYIFQFESSGMRDFLKQLKPTCFEDLIAALALFRPGPIESGMVDDVIERKHGRREIIYDLPQMEPILNNTYGVIVYQEQIMQIIHDIAGYSLEEADMLRRRLMGKKNGDVLSIEKGRFLVGTNNQGISAETADLIFERMVLYAEHTFIKAHAAAYAMISYQSAYIKAHYPEEYKTSLRLHQK